MSSHLTQSSVGIANGFLPAHFLLLFQKNVVGFLNENCVLEFFFVTLPHRHLRSDFVFFHDDGKPLRHDNVRWPLHKVCRIAGLRAIRPHDIRHSFASQLVMKGAPLMVIQELLGHSDVQTTMRYAHLASGAKRDALFLLESQNESNLCHKMVNMKITNQCAK